MSASPSNIMEQAKQGNPKAIAALMNRSLQPKGINVKAKLEQNCLHVLLESDKVPQPQSLVEFIRKGMTSLNVPAIEKVQIYARETGHETPVWQDEFSLAPQGASLPDFEDASEMPEPEPEPEPESDVDEDPLPGLALDDEIPPEEEDYEDSSADYGFEEEMPPEEMLDEDEEEFDEEEEDAAPAKKKSSKLPLLLGLLVIVILGGGGYYLYSNWSSVQPTLSGLVNSIPFIGGGEGDAPETQEGATPAAEQSAPGESGTSEAVDPFEQAVNSAIKAGEMAQTAQTQQEWQKVAEQWSDAIAKMEAVPETHEKYETAQQKATQYQPNLEYARQQAQ